MFLIDEIRRQFIRCNLAIPLPLDTFSSPLSICFLLNEFLHEPKNKSFSFFFSRFFLDFSSQIFSVISFFVLFWKLFSSNFDRNHIISVKICFETPCICILHNIIYLYLHVRIVRTTVPGLALTTKKAHWVVWPLLGQAFNNYLIKGMNSWASTYTII